MQMQVCWVNAESKKGIQSEFQFYILRTCCWYNSNYYQQTIRQQRTNKIKIISLNNDHRYLSAESMLSQKRGYKVNFISTFLGPVVEAK